jgi:hypothetical protein
MQLLEHAARRHLLLLQLWLLLLQLLLLLCHNYATAAAWC